VTLLSRPWTLHDVGDVERLCTSIVRRSKLRLSRDEEEDLTVYLIETCWELSLRYQPGTGSTTSFLGWATTNLRLRAIDWRRSRYGRTTWRFANHTYERPRPLLLSLDELDPGHDRWDNLSERGQAILRLIARPLSLGFTPQEIARGLGTSKPSVLLLVDELRTELERLASS
jgi:DNA-directed RNA polymerase specialized sigma24 family protein